MIPFDGYQELLERRFEQAIEKFLKVQDESGPSDALSSALSDAYKRLGFQTLAEQVKLSVRSAPGNRWMFEVARPEDYKYRVKPELMAGERCTLHEQVPVRMDLSHSAWSDIFFLGMDYPQGAKVINISIDLAVQGRHETPMPPIHAYFRVIDRPVIRLVSVDLDTWSEIKSLARCSISPRIILACSRRRSLRRALCHLRLKNLMTSTQKLFSATCCESWSATIADRADQRGERYSKGSRLAVSTNLLAALIAVCMRASGQTGSLTGPLTEEERRMVAGPRDSGRMAWWIGWRLAGFWRRLAGVKLIHGGRATKVISNTVPARLLAAEARVDHSPLCVRTNQSTRAIARRLQAHLRTAQFPSRSVCRIVLYWCTAEWRKTFGPILEMVTRNTCFVRERMEQSADGATDF